MGEGILNDALAHSARERCVLNKIYKCRIKRDPLGVLFERYLKQHDLNLLLIA